MKIRGDLLKISSGALNLKGEKLEPEEQMVRREVIVDAPVKHGFGAMGTNVGVIPSKIVTDQTAIQQATAMRSLCGNCLHFRNAEWLRDLAKADSPEAPIERRRAVNKIRAAIMQVQNPAVAAKSVSAEGDLDVEHALHRLGYCKALFEFFKGAGRSNDEAITIVMPESSCPADVRSDGNPDGFFQFASPEAEAAAYANYDSVMNVAAGKK